MYGGGLVLKMWIYMANISIKQLITRLSFHFWLWEKGLKDSVDIQAGSHWSHDMLMRR